MAELESSVHRAQEVPDVTAGGTACSDGIERVLLETAHSISRFPPQEWDRLLAPTDYFTHGYLKAVESSGLECEFHYAVLRAPSLESGIVALGFGCLMRFSLPWWRPAIWLAGTPVNLGLPFAFAPGWDCPAIHHRLQKALFSMARQARARYFLLRDLPAVAAGQTAAELRLHAMALHRTAVLPLPYAGFEAYLTAQKASRRQTIRRDRRAVAEAGFSLTVATPSPQLAPRLLALWMPLYLKFRDPDQIRLTEAYFRAMSTRPEAVFLLLWSGDVLAAFDLCLRHGSMLSSLYSGIDPGLCQGLPVHRFMGYAIIERALELGCRSIDFGISNEDAKQRMGCELRMLHGSGRVVSGWLHALGASHAARMLLASPPVGAKPLLTTEPGRPDSSVARAAATAPPFLRQRRQVIVIGAGLAGLAAAARLASDARLDVRLVERSPDVGGLCRLADFGPKAKGFIAGTNAFPMRFFRHLRREYGIRLPVQAARTQVFHDSHLLDAKSLLRQACHPHALNTLWHLCRHGIGSPQTSFAKALEAHTGLIGDLCLSAFLLQGQDPALWPVRDGLGKLRHAGTRWYPTPGPPAVAQALRRVFEQGAAAAQLMLSTAALEVATDGRRVIGLRTSAGDLEADAIISSLPPQASSRLLGLHDNDSGNADAGEGLSAMAVFVLLDARVRMPVGHHGLIFLRSNVAGQLQSLFAGRMPELPSFDLVSADLAVGQPGPQGCWRLTLFATVPSGCGDAQTAQQVWLAMQAQLDAQFPGFKAGIQWARVVGVDDYPGTIGCTSQLSPWAGAVPWPAGLNLQCRPAGFHVAQGLDLPTAGDSFAAMSSGWRVAGIVMDDASDSQFPLPAPVHANGTLC